MHKEDFVTFVFITRVEIISQNLTTNTSHRSFEEVRFT